MAPVVWLNLRSPVGVWDGFGEAWLTERCARWHVRRGSAGWRFWSRRRQRAWTRDTEADWRRVTEAVGRLRLGG